MAARGGGGLQKLQTFATPSTRQLARIQHDLAAREWAVKYDELAAKQPSLAMISLRAVGATVLVGVLSLLYVLMVGRAWSPVDDGWALAGFGVGALIAGDRDVSHPPGAADAGAAGAGRRWRRPNLPAICNMPRTMG